MPEFKAIAFETATPRATVAACRGADVFELTLDEGQASSRAIFRSVRQVLDKLQLEVSELDCVAFGSGPGSFTGVRVAASAAQGLAFAQDVPVVPVSTLAAIVFATGHTSGPVAACLDARMGEAYVGVYQCAADGRFIVDREDALVDPNEFRLGELSGVELAAGPGWEEMPQMLEGFAGATQTSCWPTAQSVLECARLGFAAGETVPAHAALPNYVRDNVTQ